jgi:hypothetical protein
LRLLLRRGGQLSNTIADNDTVRASRAGHTFHERWAARRSLQLVFPNDGLSAIAVEGISPTEPNSPGISGEEVADLVFYYGSGDNFETCDRLEVVQFKYVVKPEPVTGAYLKNTIEKFAETIVGYEKAAPAQDVDSKLSFIFVTNTEFNDNLWSAISSIIDGTIPVDSGAKTQANNLRKWCLAKGLGDASRLFSRTVFKSGEKGLAAQENALKRTMTDWSAGSDAEAKVRLYGLQDLIIKKAGPPGQGKNLIRREDVLDALACDPDDLFPADTRFIDVGIVIERQELNAVRHLLMEKLPIFVHAEGGVGKTVFIQSLAMKLSDQYEVVVFDCFGGGSYRSDSQSRHLPRIGLVQIVNELASRTLCDPLLPGSDDRRRIIKAAVRRLKQAALAIREQSGKLGLLVIIDAADNAQLEADHRHEDAFPKLLLAALAEDPVDGVNLLLTARTHRKAEVVCDTKVTELELGPFTEQEARAFLAQRIADASDVEVTTALARSGRNARVLDYLVNTWNSNVVGKVADAPITVPEIIKQQCDQIISDLHVAGWLHSEIIDFFVALSLLPPPIPLAELAGVLEWSISQANTAASDLAPMLELTRHGAIFRDEPTETYIRETYEAQYDAQRRIADRLRSGQSISMYAAEALPHFLVVIKDSARAFALADSTEYPSTVQSDFGRRRLTLARLRAAFRLSVAEGDFDKTLGLSMRLAQAATANMRGDAFIRRAPGLAVLLGDTDSYRRLVADRSGWRGARSARLTIAHHFAGDPDEAKIQCDSTVRWINWFFEQPQEEREGSRQDGPSLSDYAAVLFHNAIEGHLEIIDRNLARWNISFSLVAATELLRLIALFDSATGLNVTGKLLSFVASKYCTSEALALKVLSRAQGLSLRQVKTVARHLQTAELGYNDDEELSPTPDRDTTVDVIHGGLCALFRASNGSAAAIVRKVNTQRPSAYDYGERWGHSRALTPILGALLRAWSRGRRASYHDLLPREVKLSQIAKTITDKKALLTFLAALRDTVKFNPGQKPAKTRDKDKFNHQEREDIADGIELTLKLARPIENAVLSKQGLTVTHVDEFLGLWSGHLKEGVWKHERSVDLLARTVGLGFLNILFTHSAYINAVQGKKIVELVHSGRFSVEEKTTVLAHLADRSGMEELTGELAQSIAEQIRKDDNIGQRGELYSCLAEALVKLNVEEAREYYRQGLAQLDQMGAESFEQIYSLLHFAVIQRGGYLEPVLAQRLMNLCQTFVKDEPTKFGWTLFARAAARSIGRSAISKIVRWDDQDVAEMSYGLPQLVCFLAESGKLDPRRAAFVLTICEEHGWWDWNSGEAIADVLRLSPPDDQRNIFRVVTRRLQEKHPSGGWPSLWSSYLDTYKRFPNIMTADEVAPIQKLHTDAQRSQNESNSYSTSVPTPLVETRQRPTEANIDKRVEAWIAACDPDAATSIDGILKAIQADRELPFDVRQRFLDGLESACPYNSRFNHLFAITDASELTFSQTLDILNRRIAAWRSSSAHLNSKLRDLTERLIGNKGAELFQGQYSNATRGIKAASEFCGDGQFVVNLVLRKIAADEVSLDGSEWIQLATSLSDLASAEAGLDALELFLSGPASRIADEIGEGPFTPAMAVDGDEANFLADIVWHLLGDEDAYVRWNTARGLSTLVELGLSDDLGLLLARFDERSIASLSSAEHPLSFQNSQQWLLMGLARAASMHGNRLLPLRQRLMDLVTRNDVHVINRVHIARTLRNIDAEKPDPTLQSLFDGLDIPPQGIVVGDVYPAASKRALGFSFDYEFSKTEIDSAARLFGVCRGTIEDAMEEEIVRLWPDAKSMEFFPGRERFQWDIEDRYEFFREHVQRHALLSAVTSLSKTRPVVVPSYQTGEISPWLDWRQRYDVTFEDGLWLSDRKNEVPDQAKVSLLVEGIDRKRVLLNQEDALRKLGILSDDHDSPVLIYGRWSSPDGVNVSITSALTVEKGAIGRCKEFLRRDPHDFWLPEFWDGGFYDRSHRSENPFEPFVWSPEWHRVGIDVGDGIASKNASGRPRLGIDLTKKLAVVEDDSSGLWRTADGADALWSQVWGRWRSDPDDGRGRIQEDGEILWASHRWLSDNLSRLERELVFTVTLWKYRSSRSYEESSGVKCVYLGLRTGDGKLRFWTAKNASKIKY